MAEPKLTADDLILSSAQTCADVQDNGFRPRKDLSHWPLGKPIDWSANPFGEHNWRFQLHALRMADPFVADYLATHRRASARYVLEQVMDLAAYMNTHRDDLMPWHNMATGLRALKIAFLIDIAGKVRWPSSTLDRLHRLAALHVRRLSAPRTRSMSNHGFFQIFGTETLAHVCSDAPWAAEARRNALDHLEVLLDKQFTRDGVHREHSPAYHLFVLRHLAHRPSIRRLQCPRVPVIVAKATKAATWLVRPDGITVPAGDTEPAPGGTRTPNGHRFGDAIASNLHRSGYAVVRSHPDVPLEMSSMLFFTGMRWNRSHKHDDDLAFELIEFGKPIITDGGKYAYKDDTRRRFFKRQAAHSTAGIVADDDRNRPLPPYGSALDRTEHRDGVFHLAGQIEHPSYSYRRELAYRPGFSLTVTDTLRSPGSQRYISRLLFDAGTKIRRESSKGLTVSVGNHAAVIECTHPIKLVRGARRPLRGWQSPHYAEAVPAMTAEVQEESRDATFKWSMLFARDLC